MLVLVRSTRGMLEGEFWVNLEILLVILCSSLSFLVFIQSYPSLTTPYQSRSLINLELIYGTHIWSSRCMFLTLKTRLCLYSFCGTNIVELVT